MCGIAGFINHPNPEKTVRTLVEKLLHRGPDDQNTFIEKNIGFAHTRLAIQDVQHGQQPMHWQNYTIVFNGQIYNHLALRKRFFQGHQFKTHSDTETLLLMYHQFGKDMFQHLDGMFAFVILDRDKNQLFLARDRAGKKPLYYYHKDSCFVFSSELNALKAALPLSVNHDNISSFLNCGFFFKDQTPYCNVVELNAGSCLTLDLHTLSFKQESYFDILDCYQQPKQHLSLDESIQLVDHTLKAATTSRLLSSDLEVGAFLSGGIDSNLIVAMAAQQQSNLKTFTVKFPGAYDESKLARLTAERYGTQHTEIEISMNVEQDLEKILLNYGEPFFDSSAIPSYYVAQEAKKHVTVILNGDGADELFGGYRRYVPFANNWIKLAKRASWLLHILPKPHSKKSKYSHLYRLLTMANKNGLNFYCSATIDGFTDYYQFPENQIDQQIENFIILIQQNPKLSQLDKMLYLDFSLLLFSDLLVKMDIATMANSLEGRSPFLAKDILALAPTLPDHYKIQGTTTKYILRRLAETYLPPALLNQPKRGFEIPLKPWLDHELKEKLEYYLYNPLVSEYVDNQFITKLLNRKISVSDEKRAKMLWTLLTAEIWLRQI